MGIACTHKCHLLCSGRFLFLTEAPVEIPRERVLWLRGRRPSKSRPKAFKNGASMGISKATVSYLMAEGKERPFSGSVLTLGVQNIFMTEPQIERLAEKMGFALAPGPSDPVQRPNLEGYATSEYLFRRLGFDRIVTTDVSDFEDADLIFDMNAPAIPDEHRNAYDLVADCGTIEHVFHVPNALKNMIDFAKVGGRIVHMSPSSNHIDHGFYMFSPTLFWDFYSANDLEITACDLVRYMMPGHDRDDWLFGKYRPGSLIRQSFGGLSSGCYAVAAIAKKTRDLDEIVIPQQGMYSQAWAAAAKPRKVKSQAPLRVFGRKFAKTWKRGLTRTYLLIPVFARLKWEALTARFPLKVDRRY